MVWVNATSGNAAPALLGDNTNCNLGRPMVSRLMVTDHPALQPKWLVWLMVLLKLLTPPTKRIARPIGHQIMIGLRGTWLDNFI
jgi:hypothetical protein